MKILAWGAVIATIDVDDLVRKATVVHSTMMQMYLKRPSSLTRTL